MNRTYRRLLMFGISAIMVVLCPLKAMAYRVVDGICYEINDKPQTATVSYHYEFRGGWEGNEYVYKDWPKLGVYSDNIVIPDSITIGSTSYRVTSIRSSAFSGCKNLKSVSIPRSIQFIDSSAFYGCSSLLEIKIPEGVTCLCSHIFKGCSSLESVSLPSSLTTIEDYAFSDCEKLHSLTIPDHVENIGKGAFEKCSSLASLTIPESVTEIEQLTFYGCSSLTAIDLHHNITSIKEQALKECSSLESFTFPDGIEVISNSVLYGCRNLTSISIPASATSIEASAFHGCASLEEIELPESISSIGEGAFAECTALKEITLPEKVTAIHDLTFRSCHGLNSMAFHKNIATVDAYAFRDCINLKHLIFEDTEEELELTHNFDNSPIESLYIGRNIAGQASPIFTDALSLKTLNIGPYVTHIKKNLLAEKDGTSYDMVSYAAQPPTLEETFTGASSLVVPQHATVLYARANNWGLIPIIYAASDDGVRHFPVLLDQEGEGIVSLNDTAGDIEVEEDSVVAVSRIRSVSKSDMVIVQGKDIAADLQMTGSCTFTPTIYHTENVVRTAAYPLTQVYNAASGSLLDLIGTDRLDSIYCLKVSGELNGTDILALRKMPNLHILDLEDAAIANGGLSYFQQYNTSENEIGDYFFHEKLNLSKLLLPKQITRIGSYAFAGMSNLRSLFIPKNVVYIGSQAFDGCDGLESLYFEDGNKTLDFYQNYTYWTIKYLHFGRSMSGYSDIGHLDNLKYLTIGDSVESIESGTFSYCRELVSVDIRNSSLKNVFGRAFEGCTNIKYLNISDLFNWRAGIWFEDLTSNPLYYAHRLYVKGEEITELDFSTNTHPMVRSCSFAGFTGLKKLTLDNISTIGSYAFYGCSGLEELTLPGSVQSIGASAFEQCHNITTLTIPSNVEKLSTCAFKHCKRLQSISFEEADAALSCGQYVLEGCPIKEIHLNRDLQELSIHDWIRGWIKEQCSFFETNCPTLEKIMIGRNVTNVAYRSFGGCENVKEVHSYNQTPPEITAYTFNNNTYSDATLYIPSGCKTLYWLHPYWENFSKMEEVDVSEDISENLAAAQKAYAKAKNVWSSYLFYYQDAGMAFYHQVLEEQAENDETSNEIIQEIEALRKTITESELNEEEKLSFLERIDSIAVNVDTLQEENKYGHSITFYDCVQGFYDDMSAYLVRLTQYEERIRAATTNKTLEDIIAEMEQDAKTTDRNIVDAVRADYHNLVLTESRIHKINVALAACREQLQYLSDEIDEHIASSIDAVVASPDVNVAIYTLRGERMTVKKSQIKTLPAGIYIINRKKYHIDALKKRE